MSKLKKETIKNWIRKNFQILTILFGLLFILLNFLLLRIVPGNHLAYSHIMYIPIVIVGSLLGSYYGMGAGVIASLLVGPLTPYIMSTGQPQFWMDWVFRLLMMVFVGYISGWFSRSYRIAREKISELEYINPDTLLFNINYLNKNKLEIKKVYTISTLLISNCDTICDVVGYAAYYKFLFNIKEIFTKQYPDIMIVQTNIDHLWIIKPTNDFEEEIENYVEFIHQASHVLGQHLFVDFAFGFSQRKHIHQNLISDYFIQSDQAAREAKKNHLTSMIFSDLNTHKAFEYEILSDFSDALKNGQIYLLYQPKLDLKTRKPIGLEALIRWNHPTKKMIMPDQFIPPVENTNMIHEMTEAVFRWTLEFQMKLNKKGIELPISINISTKNLYNKDFYNRMSKILKDYPVKSNLIELEITETILMENPEDSKLILDSFSNEGYRIAIDDFGKGYSSLAYLAQFPITTIKVDRFFTKQILINPTTQHIVKATIDLAKQLGYEVVIEGIEDAETADLMQKLGGQSAQGYLFMRPSKEDDLMTYLNQYRDELKKG
ncbi:MAG: EAL domain-containing protein [Tenericutes bacterium]|nr:EAL domain-containing protein [Mycoplasmatota bacterium]